MNKKYDALCEPAASRQTRSTGRLPELIKHRARVSAQIQRILKSTASLEDTIRRLCALICRNGHEDCRRKVTEVCARVSGLQEALVDLALFHRQRTNEERRKSGLQKRK